MTPLTEYLDFSMDLVTHLGNIGICQHQAWPTIVFMYNAVSCVGFKPTPTKENILVSGCELLDKLIEGWKLCRGM